MSDRALTHRQLSALLWMEDARPSQACGQAEIPTPTIKALERRWLITASGWPRSLTRAGRCVVSAYRIGRELGLADGESVRAAAARKVEP